MVLRFLILGMPEVLRAWMFAFPGYGWPDSVVDSGGEMGRQCSNILTRNRCILGIRRSFLRTTCCSVCSNISDTNDRLKTPLGW